jgi:hypothetical protein
MALAFVPSHVNETSDPVDNLGGVLSVLFVAALVLAINLAATPNRGALTLGLTATAAAAGIAFFIQQRRARVPLYDLRVAKRRVFWVAAGAGIIVFGTLMGAMFVGQQFLQNVLGYSTLGAGLAILPAAAFMVLTAPHSARLVSTRGSRFTLLTGYLFCLLGFLTMFLLWKEGISYWKVGLGYAFIGIGVGFAGTPASHSLTGSVPVDRAGMASGTADLQRDLGGCDHAVDPRRTTHGRLRRCLWEGHRKRTERRQEAHYGQCRTRASEVIRRCSRHRSEVSAIRGPNYCRGEVRVFVGRSISLRCRDCHDPARRCARILPVPKEG